MREEPLPGAGALVTPRPLLLAPASPAGVSLPGLIAASARLNVLGNVKSTLTAIGLPANRPGSISLVAEGKEAALADRLGCPEQVVRDACTPFIGRMEDRVVRWGDGELYRLDLDTRRRRIAVGSLSTSHHHRAAWCNRLLDFCPESLELLVDKCQRCGSHLGWRSAWGIDSCDDRLCGAVEPSGTSLPGHLVEHYRLFANLCSPVSAERAAGVGRLLPELTRLRPVTLTDLALKLGAALHRHAPLGHDRFRGLDPGEKAEIAAAGACALLEWPTNLRNGVREVSSSRALQRGAARRSLRAALLAAGEPIGGGDQASRLIKEALPEIDLQEGRIFVGFADGQVLGSHAAQRIGVSHAELKELAAADGLFDDVGVLEPGGRRALYRADQIDAAADAWRGSVKVEAAMRRLGLPRYACERIVGCGDIPRESHPFALRLGGQPRVRAAALESFVDELETACRHGAAPAGTIRIEAAMRAVGGRLKPWRSVLAAVRSGAIVVWLAAGDGPVVPRMWAHQRDLERHLAMRDPHVLPGAHLSDTMSQIEAVGVLNLRQIDGPRLVEAGLLSFRSSRRSLQTPVAEVLTVATTYISTSEAAARLSLSPMAAWHQISSVLGPPTGPAGWTRSLWERRFQ